MTQPIAVVGLACRLPGAASHRELWDNLCAGREAIARVDENELRAAGVGEDLLRHPRFVPAGGCVADPLAFDAEYFDLSPADAAAIDPQHRVFLETAVHALQDAALDPARFPGRVAVYAGASRNTYEGCFLTEPMPALQRQLGNDADHLATRVAFKLGLTGPAVNVQTACSTSLVAVHHACACLLAGEADAAIAGGVSLRFPHAAGYVYEPGGIASPDGRCRPFDASAAGTVRGTGAGAVILRRLDDALAGGDPIRAVILGTAINNDGGDKVGYSAPSVRGQAAVVAAAQRRAGVRPEEVGYVEAHGTATPLGDPIEVAALARAFGPVARGCRLGAVKGNLGHLDAAAGVAGLIKTVLAVEHGRIPPTLHFRAPNPELRLDATPFVVAAALEEWEGERTAGVSSFGMGGTNAHAIVRQAPAAAEVVARDARPQLVVVSAPDAAGARRAAGALARGCAGAAAADVAWTTQVGRTARRARMAVRCSDATLVGDLDAAAASGRVRVALDDPRVALLLPGQGSGAGGWLAGAAARWPEVADDLRRLCGALGTARREEVLRALTVPGAAGERWWADTANAQPALLVGEYALALLLERLGARFEACAGHSVGDVVAAALCGAFPEAAAVQFAAARGRIMAGAPAGAMASVALPAEWVLEALPPSLDLAAVNAPDRTVVSGRAADVEAFCAAMEDRGAPCRRVPVAYAFHSRLMEEAAAAVGEAARAAGVGPAARPFVSTATGTWVADEVGDPEYWAAQVRRPVLFARAIERLGEHASVFVEAGPGTTLTGLARRTLGASGERAFVAMLGEGGAGEAAPLDAVGALWCAGVAIDWRRFAAPAAPRRIHLPGHPFARVRHVPRRAATPARAGHEAAPDRRDGAVDGREGKARDREAAPDRREAAPDRRDGASRRGDRAAPTLYEPLWQPLPPAAPPRGDRVALTLIGPADGLRAALADALRAQGDDVEVAAAPPPAGGNGGAIRHAVYLAPSPPPGAPPWQRFHDLLAVARGLADRGMTRLDVVARGVHAVEGGDVPQPEAALVRGVALVLPQEVAGFTCRLLDVPADGSVDAAALARELRAAAPPEVSLRGARRWARRFAPVEPPPGGGAFRPGGTYVVLGADGRIGRALVAHLTERHGARVAAVGRREPAGGDPPAALRIVRDLAVPGSVRAALALARERLGPIDAVLHLAAVTRGASLCELRRLDDAAAAEQWPAKVRATAELADAAAEMDLPLCVAFSSLASVLGGLELGAYAAANAYQDAIAEAVSRARPGTWQTIGWDAWTFGGDDAVNGFGASVRRAAIAPEAGLRALGQAVALAPTHPLVLVGDDVPGRARRWVAGEDGAGRGERSVSTAEPADRGQRTVSTAEPADRGERSTATAEPADRGQRRVAAAAPADPVLAAVAAVLGYDAVDPSETFADLGGDSLLAVQLIGELRERLGVDVPLRAVFDADDLAAYATLVHGLAP